MSVVTYIEPKSGCYHPNLDDLYDPILDHPKLDALYNHLLDGSEHACKSS